MDCMRFIVSCFFFFKKNLLLGCTKLLVILLVEDIDFLCIQFYVYHDKIHVHFVPLIGEWLLSGIFVTECFGVDTG